MTTQPTVCDHRCIDCGDAIPIDPPSHAVELEEVTCTPSVLIAEAYDDLQRRHRVRCNGCAALFLSDYQEREEYLIALARRERARVKARVAKLAAA